MFSRLFSAYRQRLTTHPYTTNACTTGVVIGTGDTIAQYIERQQHAVVQDHTAVQTPADNPAHVARVWNPTRTAIMTSWGLLGFGPFFTAWYRIFTPGRIGGRFSGANTQSVLVKILCTSVIAIPVNASFLLYATSLEHLAARWQRDVNDNVEAYVLRQVPAQRDDLAHLQSEISERLNNRLLPILYGSWAFWSVSNYVVWSYVPLTYRMVYTSFASVLWNTWLSLKAHEASKNVATDDEQTAVQAVAVQTR